MQEHICPPLSPNPVCKHGRPATIGLHQECRGDMHIITGTMALCPQCLQEQAVRFLVFS